MIRMRYIFQSINVINSLLILVIAAVSYFTIIPFLNLDIQISLPRRRKRLPPPEKSPLRLRVHLLQIMR